MDTDRGSQPTSKPGSSIEFIAATCPTCGGELSGVEGRSSVKCLYCGNEVIIQGRSHAGSEPTNEEKIPKAAPIPVPEDYPPVLGQRLRARRLRRERGGLIRGLLAGFGLRRR